VIGWTAPTTLPAALGGGHTTRVRPAPARPGWGRIDVSVSVSRAGRSWTDHGTARQERGSLVPELSPPSSSAAAWARSSNPASRGALAASAASSLSGSA
jgi:hypothetical protein